MISYILTMEELKYMCGILNVQVLPLHMISGGEISESEYGQARHSLEEKGFIELTNGDLTVNSVIEFIFQVMNASKRIFVGNGDAKFTAYIGKCAVLLINSFGKLALLPFETEMDLVNYLREHDLSEWTDIRLE